MKHSTKKWLSVLLALSLVFGMLPTTVFAADEGLPIYFFISRPGSQPSPSGTYEDYDFLASQGSAMSTAEAATNAEINTEEGIRNVSPESLITQYVASWPTGYDAETFKAFGEMTLWGTTYSDEDYEITWITICKRQGGQDCYCGRQAGEHIHIDGVLSKKIQIPTDLVLYKTIEEAQTEDNTFTFTLEKLQHDENYAPKADVDTTFTPISLTATMEAGETEAQITSEQSVYNDSFGYYRIRETTQDKTWNAQNDIYVSVATNGTIEYSYSLSGFGSMAKPTIRNLYQDYTVTYTDGLNDRVAFEDESYVGLHYGVSTPSFQGGTPMDPNDQLVFTGWSPVIADTVTTDVTYTAQWQEKAYTVTWLNDDGSVLETDNNVPNKTTPTYDGETPIKTSDSQYSYTFDGWSPAITPVNGSDQTYTAVYKPVLNSYTVTWADSDDTELEKDENVSYGVVPTYDNANSKGTPDELARAKSNAQYTYSFAGWTPTVRAVTGDIEYKATYTVTENTYTVTWVNYNGSVLETDTSVKYGTDPEYNKTNPERPATAQYTYTFTDWSPELSPVTGDITYTAQFEAEQRNYTVSLKLYLDDVLVNSSSVHDPAVVPELRTASDATPYVCTLTDQTGIYRNTDVPNGTYQIYSAGSTEPLCDQIIVVENTDVEKACYYYTVTYDANGGTNAPATEKHHIGEAVSVSSQTPAREGYIFKGWTVDTDTVLQPGESLTDNIIKAYTLTAKWAEAADVTVNVYIDHEADGVCDDNEEKDQVIIELVSRPKDGSSAWLEVPNTIVNLSSDSYDGFSIEALPTEAATPEEYTNTNYLAQIATFANVEAEGREFSLTFQKASYSLDTTKGDNNSGIQATKDANGDWTINLYLKFTPSYFDLEFSVAMDNGVPKAVYPDAVIARVLFWDSSNNQWDYIMEHSNGQPGVSIPIDDNGEGTGSYTVWGNTTESNSTPYDYRFEVSAFVYDGQIVPATSNDLISYTDGTYTAEMQDVLNPDDDEHTHNELEGAYYENSSPVGTLHAIIDVSVYQVTIVGNGGYITESKETVALSELIKMPDIAGYVPTHKENGYVFDGYDWYVDTDSDGVYDAETDTAADAVATGDKLESDFVLVAKWKAPWTVKGTIEVDGTYELDGETKVIQDADRMKNVTVLLQYAPAGSTVFSTMQTVTASITYTDNVGKGSYEFTEVPNDGGTWRVHVLNHNYTTTYKNEVSTVFAAENNTLTSPSIAQDNDSDHVAVVDVNMVFSSQNFDLYYKIIATDIGEGFRPTKAEVLILYDNNLEASDSPRNWPVISQMQDSNDSAGYTGKNSMIDTEDKYCVWIYHPLGYLYDYAIKVQAVDNADITGNEPYTIEYNGSAEYANPGYTEGKTQTQLITATFKPKSYPITYYLEKNSTTEITAMRITSHTWSFVTNLKDSDGNWIDVPTRDGFVFAGWVDADDKAVDSIAAAVAAETKLYATWEVDQWKDADKTPDEDDKDSPTDGDGIPDSQQIHILYQSTGNGTTSPVGEIVTISGTDYADVTVTATSGSTPTAASGYAYDKWTYKGSDKSGDNATVTLDIDSTTHRLTPTITNANGGTTFTFEVSFAEDKIGPDWPVEADDDDLPDDPDGIPDKYQAVVEFHSANTNHGTVTGEIYQVFTFKDNNGNYTASGTVKPSVKNVTVTPAQKWAFDHWIKDNGTTKLDAADVETEISNVSGGTYIRFYANFAIDEWKDDPDNNDDDSDASDGIPDYKQVLVEFIPSANSRGEVTGKGAVQVFTLPETNGGFKGSVEPINTADIPVVAEPNDGYTFHYWADTTNFWKQGSGAVVADPFQLHENVVGGQIIVYTAHFDVDVWDDADDNEHDGDNIPDSEQVLIRYASADTEMGTVAPTVEVITLPSANKHGPEDLQGNGSVAAAADGHAFDRWNCDKTNVEYDSFADAIDPELIGAKGGDIYNFTASFGIDEVGNPSDPTIPDNIPDKYQKKVTFVVVNGAWNDGTIEDKVVYVSLKKDNMWNAAGSGTLTAPEVGSKPDDGFKAGSWDTEPPTTVSGTEDAVYTYTYERATTPIVPVDSVRYIVEHYKANADGTYPADPTDEEILAGKIGTTVTAAAKEYEGYCLNTQVSTMSGTLVKLESNDDIVVLKLYYDIDTVGKDDPDDKETLPDAPDDIPDKYQKKVTFVVVNGAWDDGTSEDKVVYVTLENDGKWDKDGSGSLTAPEVGSKPDDGFKAGSWDIVPPVTVSGLDDLVYTYTYNPIVGSVTLTKVDSEDDSTTLAKVVFDLYRADGTFEGTYTTGADGTITVDDLLVGNHYWIEVRPAEGYMMNYTKHEFTITDSDTTKVTIENTRTPVPEVFSGDHFAYIIGYTDGMVHPEANITRAEVATIFFRMLDEEVRRQYMTKENEFSDVEEGKWYNTAISTMAAMDIVNGFPDGTFRPNENTTRAEFAAIAARFDENGNTTGVSFSDIYEHWARKEINVAYNNGWILGYTDGKFNPDQNISRAEAMTMVNRVLQRVPHSAEDLLDQMVQWPDNMNTDKWYYLAVQEATNSHDYERKTNGYEYWTELREVRDWTELEK